MPSRIFLTPTGDLGVVEIAGDVAWPDLAAAARTLYSHPAWRPDSSVFWDLSGITAVDIQPADLPVIKAFVTGVAEARAAGRSALHVRHEPDAMLAVLFDQMGPPSERLLKTFYDRANALAFLGLDALPEGLEEVN